MENLGDILKRIAQRAASGEAPTQEEPPDPSKRSGCSTCNGSGWLSHRRPVGHPEFGQAFPCPECQPGTGAPHRRELLTRYSKLGILTKSTFESTNPEGNSSNPADQAMFGKALRETKDYAESPSGCLALTGPSGSGKTHLAAAIANHCIERNLTTLFVLTPDLLDHLRATYAPSNEITYDQLFEQVRTVPMLVLDDLGSHSATPWAEEKLFQIFNYRHNNELATVITVRGSLEGLDEALRTRIANTDGRSKVLQLGRFTARAGPTMGEPNPELLERMTFATFNPKGNAKATPNERYTLEQAMNASRTFAQTLDGWLLLAGAPGSGKTHLAVAIAGDSKARGQEVFYTDVPGLLDRLRTAYGPNSQIGFDELFEHIRNVELLVLDDLGAENSTPWAEEKLLQVIVHRHQQRLPTVITTTHTMDELERARPRIASRLLDQDGSHMGAHRLSQLPRPAIDRPIRQGH